MFDDYDLYNLVHKPGNGEPNTSRKTTGVRSKSPRQAKKSILLTAKSLDSHFTNGSHDWCLLDCGCDLYRTLVKSMIDPKVSRSRLDIGELVFFDFQPLSTRLALMTKFIEIAQGGTLTPTKFITVYDPASPGLTTSRSKSFDSSLSTGGVRASASAAPRRGIVMPNSGLYVKIWANDEAKLSVFGTDPFTRMNRLNYEACKLVPGRTSKPARSSKISQLMSNFEQPQESKPELVSESKTVWNESSLSETSLTSASQDQLVSSNITSANKTFLTKSYSENNPRVLNTGVRTTTTTTHELRHEHKEEMVSRSGAPTQRVSIPIRVEDPSLLGTTNVLSDGSVRPSKTEVYTYSYRKFVEPTASTGKKREQVRFDDSWEKAGEQNGSQKKLLRSSEWALAKQNFIKKDS